MENSESMNLIIAHKNHCIIHKHFYIINLKLPFCSQLINFIKHFFQGI